MAFADISRKQAFSAHLAISLLVFFGLFYMILFHWYPSYYFHIDGGYRGIATIFFVDVVLGPGLTLLVFKPGKPGLKFDMTAIIVMQILALSWGLKSVVSERPMMTVFYDGKFSCVSYSDMPNVDLDRLALDHKGAPLLAVLPRPDTHDEYQDMMKKAFSKGSAEIYVFNEKLIPMDVVGTVHVMNYKLDVAGKFVGSDADKQKYDQIWADYIEQNPDTLEQYLYYPLSCRYRKVLAVFDAENSEIVDFLPVYTERAESTIKLSLSEKELREAEKLREAQDGN